MQLLFNQLCATEHSSLQVYRSLLRRSAQGHVNLQCSSHRCAVFPVSVGPRKTLRFYQGKHDDEHIRPENIKPVGLPQSTLPPTTDSSLLYKIPYTILRSAREASRGPKKDWIWYTYDLYRNAAGKRVTLEYCNTLEESERAAQKFLSERIVGLDLEWKPFRTSTSIKENVSLIQVACEDRIALFHIALHRGTQPQELIAPSLIKLLESKTILKCGVAIRDADGTRLTKFLGLRPRALVDLNDLHQAMAIKGESKREKTRSLSDLVEQYLHLQLHKGRVRISDWSQSLSHAQVVYAATDAYASFALYHAMESTRVSLGFPSINSTAEETALSKARQRTMNFLSWERDQFAQDLGVAPGLAIPYHILDVMADYMPSSIRRIRHLAATKATPPYYLDLEAATRIRNALKARFTADARTSLVNQLWSKFRDASKGRKRQPIPYSRWRKLAVQIVQKHPKSQDDLLHIGMTQDEVDALGDRLLEAIEEFRRQHGITESTEEIWRQRELQETTAYKFEASMRNLDSFREDLARQLGVRPDTILSDDTMQELATQEPRTPAALSEINGAENLFHAQESLRWSEQDLLHRIKKLYAVGAVEDTLDDPATDSQAAVTIEDAYFEDLVEASIRKPARGG